MIRKLPWVAAAATGTWIGVRHLGFIPPLHVGVSDRGKADKILDAKVQNFLVASRREIWVDPAVTNLPAYKTVRWSLRPVILEPTLAWGITLHD